MQLNEYIELLKKTITEYMQGTVNAPEAMNRITYHALETKEMTEKIN